MANFQVDIDPNKVSIYVRWSTDEQTLGTTLQTQLNACKNYLLSQGWNINENLIFIDDGYSGANLKRPFLTNLRNLIKEDKIQCVIVYKLDRLSRNLKDAVNLILDEWEDICFLKSVTEPLDTTTVLGKQIFYILAGFAEMERELIKERTWGGKLARAKEGKNPGITAPYGYTNDKNFPGHYFVIEEQKIIVNKIYDLYLEGKGTRAIAELLNSQNIKFKKNKPFSQATIHHMLSNPFYYGYFQYGKRTLNHKRDKDKNEPYWTINKIPLTEGMSIYIEPIILKEKWDNVQKVKSEKNVINSRISGRVYSSPHLLTGLLFCKKCGHSIGGHRNIKKNKEIFYYRCRGYVSMGKVFCNNGYSLQAIVDSLVIEKLKERFIPEINRKQLVELLNDKNQKDINFLISQNHQLQDQIKEFNRQLSKLENDYRSGELSSRNYDKFEEKMSIDKINAELQLCENDIELSKLNSKIIDKKDIQLFVDVLNEWENYSIEEKKTLLRKWIFKIYLFKSQETKEIDLNIKYFWDTKEKN